MSNGENDSLKEGQGLTSKQEGVHRIANETEGTGPPGSGTMGSSAMRDIPQKDNGKDRDSPPNNKKSQLIATPVLESSMASSSILRPDITYDFIDQSDFGKGVVASSTPERLTFEANTELGPTEETPLIAGSDLENWAGVGFGVAARRRELQGRFLTVLRRRRLWKAVILILFLVLLISGFFLLIDFQKLTNEAFTPEIESLSVLGVNEKGIAFQVMGTIITDYNNVSNPLLRHLARFGSLLIGGVVITPRDKCSLFVSTSDLQSVHLLDMFPSELGVDLIDHRASDFEFVSDANFADSGMARILESISLSFEEPQLLEVEARLSPRIRAKWFRFHLKTASIIRKIKFPPKLEKFSLSTQKPTIIQRKKKTEVSLTMSLPIMPANLTLQQVEWNIAIPDCEHNPISIGEWETSALKFNPEVKTNFSLSGVIKEVPPALLRVCSNGFTPINSVLRLAVNDRTLRAFINGKTSELNLEKLPTWLYEVLVQMSLNVSLPVPKLDGSSEEDPIREYKIGSSSVAVKSELTGELSMLVNTKANAELRLPVKLIGVGFSASDIKSKLWVSQPESNEYFLEALVPGTGNMHLTSLQSTADVVTLDYGNVSFEISQPIIAGRYVNSILTGCIAKVPDWTVGIQEMVVHLSLISTILKDLRFVSGPSSHPDTMALGQRESSFIDWLLENAQILAEKILCVGSRRDKVELIVDFQVSNPLNVSIEVINDVSRFDLKYNQTTICTVLLENLKVPKLGEKAQLSACLTLFYDSAPQRTVSEEFLSRIISGSNDIFFGIAGHQANTPKEKTGLAEFLLELELEHVHLPKVNFARDDEIPTTTSTIDGEPKHKQSPFLVSATFHLWASEIELTVYNPIANVALKVQIIKCLATYEGTTLAHIEGSAFLVIPPGISTTPRIPITVSKGLGADILRKYINGDLAVDVLAELGVFVDQFPAELMYSGTGLAATVKI